eukprot:Seg1166.7 transcript_id=Seg1166.7/GoldUCD/mRNA.D3Y31 product="hypothetical protein" protein_id=Seg1166.7/GoldUCD/D3Y31
MPKETKARASEANVSELFQENVRLKQKRSGFDDEEGMEHKVNARAIDYCLRLRKALKLICPIVIVLIVFVTCITLLLMYYVGVSSTWKLSGNSHSVTLKQNAMIGQRNDKDIQDCQNNGMKKTFPDIDYSFYGYNILRGYPMAVGHDPGITHPIFQHAYSEKKQSADCRYSVPNGLIAASDVSCVTSFTSSVARDSRQMSKSLSVSAQVSGGGFEVSFSASAEYKKKTSEMSSRSSIFIYSQAKCDYYFAMLDEINPPPLSKSFIQFSKGLKTTKDVFKLFEYYGTHFMKHVTFGAKFIYEHKMSKTELQKSSSSSFSLSVQASYSGMFSFGGGMGMSSAQQQAAQSFQSKVETSTISVGAPPPANGDTMTWASTVKETPVPTRYKLSPIEELFTATYMAGTGVDYKHINDLVTKAKTRYCKELLEKGEVNTCQKLQSYKEFPRLCLGTTWYRQMATNFDGCVSACLDQPACIAVGYHTTGSSNCFLFNNKTQHTATVDAKARVVLFIDNMELLGVSMTIRNVALKDGVEKRELSGQIHNMSDCATKCKSDARNCIAYTITSVTGNMQCKLYSEAVIVDESIEYKKDALLKIVPSFLQQ